jgi:hypothetical protein
MRRTKAGSILGAVLGTAIALVSGRATAAETKGDTGGKGGLSPKGTTAGEESSPDTAIPLQRNVDRGNTKAEEEKPWELGATFETHRSLVQDDLVNGAPKVYNLFGVYGLYRLTQNDAISLREYFTEGFVADPGETGVRADDISLAYTHSVPLPRNFLFSATGSLSAPTSLTSQKQGLITAPRLNLAINKRFGRYISAGANLGGGVWIDRYAEAEGGAANPLAQVAGTLFAEVIMPFHEPLSIGASASTGYFWLYNVQSGDPAVVQPGVVADANYPNQPVTQTYGAEIHVRYALPTLAGVKSDILIAADDGGPGLNDSVLHDGVGYLYLFDREQAEVYASFTVRY